MKRTGCHSFCLIYDGTHLSHAINPSQPYVCIDETIDADPITGLQQWPIVFICPTQAAPLEQHNLISLLLSHQDALSNPDYIYDSESEHGHTSISYCITKIDARMYMAVTFQHTTPSAPGVKRRLNETVIADVSQITQRLRHLHILQQLQPHLKKK